MQERGNQVLGAGLTWAASVALLAYGGFWLDGRLGCSPLLLILGALAGAAGGFIHFLSRVAPDVLPWRRPRPPSSDSESKQSQ